MSTDALLVLAIGAGIVLPVVAMVIGEYLDAREYSKRNHWDDW